MPLSGSYRRSGYAPHSRMWCTCIATSTMPQSWQVCWSLFSTALRNREYLTVLKSALLTGLCPPRQFGWAEPRSGLGWWGPLAPDAIRPRLIRSRWCSLSLRPDSEAAIFRRRLDGHAIPSVVGLPKRAAAIFARASVFLAGLSVALRHFCRHDLEQNICPLPVYSSLHQSHWRR